MPLIAIALPQSTVANGASANAAISGDGRFVAFGSFASALVAEDFNQSSDIFVYDRMLDSVDRRSKSIQVFTQPNGRCLQPCDQHQWEHHRLPIRCDQHHHR